MFAGEQNFYGERFTSSSIDVAPSGIFSPRESASSLNAAHFLNLVRDEVDSWRLHDEKENQPNLSSTYTASECGASSRPTHGVSPRGRDNELPGRKLGCSSSSESLPPLTIILYSNYNDADVRLRIQEASIKQFRSFQKTLTCTPFHSKVVHHLRILT